MYLSVFYVQWTYSELWDWETPASVSYICLHLVININSVNVYGLFVIVDA